MSFRTCFGIDFLTKVLLFLYSLSVFPAEIRCSSYCSHLSRIRRNRLSYESFIIFVFAFGISCGNTLFELLLSPFTNTSELTFLRKFHYCVFAFGISYGNTLFELSLSPFANTSELTFLRKSIPWINTF